jgi:hypothetical protein
VSDIHKDMISNRKELVEIFTCWLNTLQPGVDGILRGGYLGCEKFYFEVHCLFLKGTDNMHYNMYPFPFYPNGYDMNNISSSISESKLFGREVGISDFRSLRVSYNMPKVLEWSLEGIAEELHQIFDKHVNKFKLSIMVRQQF